MGRMSTLPYLLDDTHFVSITKLKVWGYLESNKTSSGTVNWSRNGENTGSIGIDVNTEEMYVRLHYTYRKTDKVDYKVRLVRIPSNLGKGHLWYFVCPHTGKMCRKLFSVGREFLHRTAYKNCRYESQTYSKRDKAMIKVMDAIMKGDEAYGKMNVKHFKKYYNGVPPKST